MSNEPITAIRCVSCERLQPMVKEEGDTWHVGACKDFFKILERNKLGVLCCTCTQFHLDKYKERYPLE